MKAMVFLFACFFTGAAMLFSGCSEDNSLVPSQNDEISLKSKKIPTHFTGTCEPISPDDGIFYDNASDERVTGISIWATTVFEPVDEITFIIAGTAEIFVGAENVDDVNSGNYSGKWEMTWKGTQTLTSPDGSTFRLLGQGVGNGTEGTVLGLTARWKYSMNFDGTPESFIYISKGKITEEL